LQFPSAFNAGLEAEVRKSLDFIPGFGNFAIVLNSSLIKSQVNFPEGTLSRDRPLGGQSPFIVNTGIFYQGKTNGLMVNLMYNIIGKRIVYSRPAVA
jgi:hypothetical protein